MQDSSNLGLGSKRPWKFLTFGRAGRRPERLRQWHSLMGSRGGRRHDTRLLEMIIRPPRTIYKTKYTALKQNVSLCTEKHSVYEICNKS
jgi:hypothetical protein